MEKSYDLTIKKFRERGKNEAKMKNFKANELFIIRMPIHWAEYFER